MAEAVLTRGDPSARIAEVYAGIWHTRMADVPILNARLRVEAVGFREWDGQWLGALVTPWSLNLMLLPGTGAWTSLPSGRERFVDFPAGRFRFISAHVAPLGESHGCSLFSPVLEFADHEAARLTAAAALAALFDPPVEMAPATLSRRAFLSGKSREDENRGTEIRGQTPISPEACGDGEIGVCPRISVPQFSTGEVVVRVDCAGGRVTRAEAHSRRPRVAGKALPGRTATEAVALVQNLFSICGRAQGVAAAAATDAACGKEPSPALAAARERRLAAEAAHEHFWRVLIDWPGLAGQAPETSTMGAIRKLLAPWLHAEAHSALVPVDAIAAQARRSVFACDAQRWLEIASLDRLLAWSEQGETLSARMLVDLVRAGPARGASEVALMEQVDAAALAEVLDPALGAAEDFEATPEWLGEPRETGAIARVQSHPLVAELLARWGRSIATRAVARLVDLAQLVLVLAGGEDSRPRHGACRLAGGAGLSWVETARGLLVHRAAIAGGRIAGYRIVAPTEWNFHPRGAFVRGALALSPGSREELERDTRQLVASLDPCVAWRVEAGHA
jgi:[NiFe] hydrogenase assembly HybE family chaperone